MSDNEHDNEAGAATDPDLGGLLAGAQDIDGAAVAVVQQQAMAQAADDEEAAAAMVPELVEVLKLARSMVQPAVLWWADYERVWSDHTITAIAQNGVVIMIRQGWTVGEMFSKWGPYIGITAATLPAVLATVAAIKQRKAEAHGSHQ
jgi:hypothetical protein